MSVALLWALKYGNASIAVQLIEANADPNVADGAGKSALHCACEMGDLAVVQLLLQNGANVRHADIYGCHGNQLPYLVRGPYQNLLSPT